MSTPVAEAPWNYLKLCQETAVECGIAGASLAAMPVTTTGQTGELLRLCRKVADAWREIQGHLHWAWMWEEVTITVPATASFVATGIPDDRWDKEGAYVPTVSSDNAGRHMAYLPWREFRLNYPRMLAGSSMSVWSIDPSSNFWVNGIVPAPGLDIRVQRYANPTALRADADVPGMPADLQMLIVYIAKRKFEGFDEAGTQRAIAIDESRDLMRDLRVRCLPSIRLGGTLLDYYGD